MCSQGRLRWDPAALQQQGPRDPCQPAAPAAPGPRAFLEATWDVTSVTKNPLPGAQRHDYRISSVIISVCAVGHSANIDLVLFAKPWTAARPAAGQSSRRGGRAVSALPGAMVCVCVSGLRGPDQPKAVFTLFLMRNGNPAESRACGCNA